jgi:sugar-specific transcriptional regulator TrmB
MDILSLELRKLGLKEREAKIYLAGLELGATSIQNLAEKAGVTRPTAYEIVRTLQEKGLFREAQQGKKRYFLAQSPERILSMLRLQKRELEEKEREFIRIIAALESKYAFKDGGVQIFKGKEGLRVLQEQILFTSTKDIVVFTSERAQVRKYYTMLQKRLGKLLVRERIVPDLKGTLFLGEKAIFISAKKQEGYLIDSLLVVDSLKRLV